MAWMSVAVAAWIGGGLLAWVLPARSRLAPFLGAGAAVVASLSAIAASLDVLLGAGSWSATLPWSLPLGLGAVGLDPLSAWFLLAIAVVTGVAAPYGVAYLRPEAAHRPVGATWLPYNLLAACLAGVVLARDGMVLLLAWEGMTLASFALVVFDHPEPATRRAGFLYLLFGHVGGACLLVLFLLLDDGSGTLAFPGAGSLAPSTAIFLLALAGFGIKAGLFPVHSWLPEAHSAAPTHVSAVMSGVLLKMGIYGLFRSLSFFATLPAAWGFLVLGLGLASALLGVLSALAQHDLKRLLAYHSVENIGLIAMAAGLSMVARSAGLATIAWLGMAAALLHVLNHALFKSLLFLGAGAVVRMTGTRDIDLLGGLLRRSPPVGWLFLVGAAAIAGLPPLNGFVSEALLLLSGFEGLLSRDGGLLVPAGVAVTAGLAVVGSLAAACFAKVVGVVFLGESRSRQAAEASLAPVGLWAPLIVLAAACLAIGLLPLPAISVAEPAIAQCATRAGVEWQGARALLSTVAAVGAFLLLAAGILVAVRRRLSAARPLRRAVTWDCGYEAPDARMQYTAASFARPIVEGLEPLLGVRVVREGPSGLLPAPGHLAVEVRDRLLDDLLRPAGRGLCRLAAFGRVFQRGSVRAYLLYILVTLVALLVAWKEV